MAGKSWDLAICIVSYIKLHFNEVFVIRTYALYSSTFIQRDEMLLVLLAFQRPHRCLVLRLALFATCLRLIEAAVHHTYTQIYSDHIHKGTDRKFAAASSKLLLPSPLEDRPAC
jgi:hypothetical protein